LAATLLAALVWILCLLARRLVRFLAGLSGLIALSFLLTILVVGIALFVITSPQWSNILQLSITVVRSGKLKRESFNSNLAGRCDPSLLPAAKMPKV
jgi:hypothetical protein